jgi:glutathione S-transferase
LLEKSLPFESITLDPRKKNNEKRTLLEKNHQKELDTLKVNHKAYYFA